MGCTVIGSHYEIFGLQALLSDPVAGSAGIEGVGRAADVAARLVRVYGELRQVETLLHSLISGLNATTCTAAATRVIDSAPVKAALQQVIP